MQHTTTNTFIAAIVLCVGISLIFLPRPLLACMLASEFGICSSMSIADYGDVVGSQNQNSGGGSGVSFGFAGMIGAIAAEEALAAESEEDMQTLVDDGLSFLTGGDSVELTAEDAIDTLASLMDLDSQLSQAVDSGTAGFGGVVADALTSGEKSVVEVAETVNSLIDAAANTVNPNIQSSFIDVAQAKQDAKAGAIAVVFTSIIEALVDKDMPPQQIIQVAENLKNAFLAIDAKNKATQAQKAIANAGVAPNNALVGIVSIEIATPLTNIAPISLDTDEIGIADTEISFDPELSSLEGDQSLDFSLSADLSVQTFEVSNVSFANDQALSGDQGGGPSSDIGSDFSGGPAIGEGDFSDAATADPGFGFGDVDGGFDVSDPDGDGSPDTGL